MSNQDSDSDKKDSSCKLSLNNESAYSELDQFSFEELKGALRESNSDGPECKCKLPLPPTKLAAAGDKHTCTCGNEFTLHEGLGFRRKKWVGPKKED